MSRGFVRTLWGVGDINNKWFKHRLWINDHLQYLKFNQYDQPFTALVFGEDNYKQLVDMGFNCQLVDKRPVVWDMNKEQYRHKIEALKIGMTLFDEMVFLDWDTQLKEPLPNDFWESLQKKSPIQASLRQYHRKKAIWRKDDPRKVPCAAFIYLRDKSIPDKLIQIWEDLGRPSTEECVLMKYMDDSIGGWKGLDVYFELFEPEFFNLEGDAQIFSDEKYRARKRDCFEHVTRMKMFYMLKEKGIETHADELTKEEIQDQKQARILARNKRLAKRRLKTLRKDKKNEHVKI